MHGPQVSLKMSVYAYMLVNTSCGHIAILHVEYQRWTLDHSQIRTAV